MNSWSNPNYARFEVVYKLSLCVMLKGVTNHHEGPLQEGIGPLQEGTDPSKKG